jgi:hypothetical protein
MRMGKLQQARLARRHFSAAPVRFLVNAPQSLSDHDAVVKSFTFKYDTGVGFYSRKVRERDLDPRFPWLLSDLVEAERDVTVAFVRDQLFAFALERAAFIEQTLDWRLADSQYAHRAWQPTSLPERLRQAVVQFMEDIGGHYARLDFLESGGAYTFLEANFTGEWCWLDSDGRHGLRDKILAEIDPRTPCHSAPRATYH